MKILFIVPYPISKSPSQRFRFEQYLKYLDNRNFKYTIHNYISDSAWNILYSKGNILKKTQAFVTGYIKRLLLLNKISGVDYVFIHRESTPIGPAIIEFIIAKIFKKKIIFDFDDAVWIAQEGYGSFFKNLVKNPSKINAIIKWSYKVSCGNQYLSEHAKLYNKNVVLNPTTIDTINLHNKIKNQKSSSIIIGWTGTQSTLMYLNTILPIIEELEKEFHFEFVVICNQNPNYNLKSFRFVQWKAETEIEDLLNFNIGIMPLKDDKWTKGKCGFKALQYMSLGIPAVVSPVGVNTEIIENGIDGFSCNTNIEWQSAIKTLIENEKLRTEMGAKAREKIIKKYSVASNKDNFLNLFS